MKKLSKLLVLVVAIFSVVLMSCEFGTSLPKLTAPKVTLEGEVLSWEAVENALSYTVYENGQELAKELTELTYTIDVDDLEPGTYKYTVRAIADGTTYANSALSNPVEYVIEDLPEYKLESKTVIADGNAHQLELVGDELPEGL